MDVHQLLREVHALFSVDLHPCSKFLKLHHVFMAFLPPLAFRSKQRTCATLKLSGLAGAAVLPGARGEVARLSLSFSDPHGEHQ